MARTRVGALFGGCLMAALWLGGGLLATGLPERTLQAIAVLLCAAFATTGIAMVATSVSRPAPRR